MVKKRSINGRRKHARRRDPKVERHIVLAMTLPLSCNGSFRERRDYCIVFCHKVVTMIKESL